jgi:hypothetical protein
LQHLNNRIEIGKQAQAGKEAGRSFGFVDKNPVAYTVCVGDTLIYGLAKFTESLILAQDERWRRA